MPFFTQALTRQPVVRRRVRLGRADFAGVQRVLEVLEKAQVLVRVLRRVFVEQPLDFAVQRAA